jgi:hypothetical protein
MIRLRKIASAILIAAFFGIGARGAPAAAATAPGWPLTLTPGGGKIIVYQPQVTAWPNQTVLEGIAAVQVTLPGTTTAVYGIAKYTSFTSADLQTGTVQFTDTRILSTSWPNQTSATTTALDTYVRNSAQFSERVIPLASVLASLNAQTTTPASVPVRTAPPTIFYTQKPAILVVFDGDPIMAPIQGTKLTFAVNTNWPVIFDPASATYYLLQNDHWIAAPGRNGPWTPATAPASFAALPATNNWQDVRAHLSAPAIAPSAMPQVFVSTTPADLIAVSGAPQFESIAGTHLRYVTNTASDLFYDTQNLSWYVLLSGRWYRATTTAGPWSFAQTTLPADFARIPINSPKGDVLVSVPGTPAAKYVGASTTVPQIATVNPQTTTITVTYGPGDPQFAPITGTTLQYALNTPYDVIKVADNQYYACYSGIWFVAATPTGPWAVATYVPRVIYTIPPSSPLYGDTFVYVYNTAGVPQYVAVPVPAPTVNTAAVVTTAVLVGFTAGYLGGYWGYGGWMYGTGYYYPGWYYGGAYYPYAATWTGGAAWGTYTTANGAYGRAASVYGPYGGATARAQYNPTTGTYARGATVYGPNGSTSAGSFYNPRYGVAGHTVQNTSPYGSWGHSSVTTRNGTAYGAHASNANGSIGAVATKNGTAAVAKTANGDVYAGHDGNVYRNQDGTWQKNTGGNSWSDVQKPTTPPAPVNRDVQARSGGDFGGFSGGGGFRGGGFGGRR